jgi:hypothetical protein
MSSCRCANSSPASAVAMSDAGRRLDHRRGGRRAGAWARPDGHSAPAGRTRRPIRSCACMTERVRTHAVARLGEDTSLKNVHTLLFPREGRRRAAAQRHEIRRVPTVARDQPRHGRSRGSRSLRTGTRPRTPPARRHSKSCSANSRLRSLDSPERLSRSRADRTRAHNKQVRASKDTPERHLRVPMIRGQRCGTGLLRGDRVHRPVGRGATQVLFQAGRGRGSRTGGQPTLRR